MVLTGWTGLPDVLGGKVPVDRHSRIARIAAGVLIALSWTWRVERAPWPVQGRSVIAFWHGDFVPMLALHRHPRHTGGAPVTAMVSLSKDGSLLATLVQALGVEVVRGSSSAGGLAALRGAVRASRAGRAPALAVDGPRGPAGTVHPGAAALARVAGVPVVCTQIVARGWRAGSWDQTVVPWPFSRVSLRYVVWRPGEGALQDFMPR